MKQQNCDIFIGGPNDGEHHAVPPEMETMQLACQPPCLRDFANVVFATSYYRRARLVADNVLFTFWVPFEQKDDVTLAKLLANYKPEKETV